MKVLIIGGAGYIGSHIAVEHIEKGHEVVIVDNMSNSGEFIIDNIKEITNKDVVFYAYDATNENLMEKVFDEHQFDLVVHFAGDISTSKSIDQPIDYLSNNVNTLLTVTNLMIKYGVKKLVFGSSSKVYGKTSDKEIQEGTLRSFGQTPYAVSKQICEDVINTLSDKINVAILRIFNPIGCHSSGKLGIIPKNDCTNILNSLYESYFNKTQFKLNGDNYKTHDGTCVRDYISMQDLMKAYNKSVAWVMDRDETEAFNICSGKGISVKEIVELFENELDEKLNIVIGSRRKGDLDRIVGSPEKTKSILNFSSTNGIINSMTSYEKWYSYITEKMNSSD